MKKFTLFFFALFAVLTAWAQSALPEFSTEAAPKWYAVQFSTGNAYLSDGAGGKCVTVAAESGNSQRFQFIGTQNSFKMKSAAGFWITFKDSRFQSSKTASDAVNLKLVKGNEDEIWEIQRIGGSNLNQFGGTGVGKELGEWTAGDNNNQLFFIETEAEVFGPPTFSTEGKDQYYFISFVRNNQTWGVSTTAGEDLVRVYSADPVDGQLWKLVGTTDKFQIVSKTGKYINVSDKAFDTGNVGGKNPNPLRVSDTEDPEGFKLITGEDNFEIASLKLGTSKACNMWGTPGNANTIGFWNVGDANNKILFIDPAKMTYADYKTQGITGYTPEHDLTLWYKEPATTARLYSGGNGYSSWMEYALPIGDGQFGASLFGGVAKDEIQFNEKTLWTGKSTDLTGGGSGYGKYENFGSVYAENLSDAFTYASDGGATDYYRQLDLTTATGKTSFKDKAGVTYTREYIASHPARVVAAHYTADKAGQISLRFTMKSGSFRKGVTYADGEGTMSGKLNTVSYNARFKVVATGGTVTTTDKGIEVKGADEVLLLLAGGTDFSNDNDSYIANTAQLGSTIQARINDAQAKGWKELYADHVKDFQSLMGRVSFNLDGTKNVIPTDSLVDRYNGGKGDQALMLERLYFAYGRYLEIGSSRGVDLPSNLQGIWNNISNPNWNADIHSNINVQMNYWPAEPTNLSELHLPFLNYITKMATERPEWRKYATMVDQNRGWTCWTENNIFGGGTTFAKSYVIANAWYCTHLWQHYRFTLDKDFLKKAFPTMLGATQFWIDRLKKASDGTYEAPNEWSPEHGPTENGVAHAQQLVAELFANTLSAIEVLGQDEAGISDADYTKLKDRYEHLDKGLHSETYTGNWGTGAIASGTPILREWKYSSYTRGENGHRHMSHLMCMYPFSQVHPGTEQFQWAVNSMKLRGDGATGWSMGWKINLWARALDGDHARTILSNALRHSAGGSGVCYNLFDMHPPFQIDGNFGACSGIAEMLLQSNSDTIRVLPALPTAWKAGSYSGLKTVKDFTVSAEWKDGKATRITLVNNQGQTMPLRYNGLKYGKLTIDGKPADFAIDSEDMTVLSGKPGTTYVFEMDYNSEPKDPTGLKEATAAGLDITVSGRTVKATGADLKHLTVYDLEGRTLGHTAKATLTLPAAWGHSFVIEAADKAGHKVVRKVVVE